MSQVKVEKVVDAKGMLCPLPALLAMKALEKSKSGEVIKVIADCPEAKENVPRIVKSHGHRVLRIDVEKEAFTIIVEKK